MVFPEYEQISDLTDEALTRTIVQIGKGLSESADFITDMPREEKIDLLEYLIEGLDACDDMDRFGTEGWRELFKTD